MLRLILLLLSLSLLPAYAQEANGNSVWCVLGPLSASPAACQLLPPIVVTSPLSVGTNSGGSVAINLNGASGSSKQIAWDSAGVLRWQLFADSSTESGGDAGSNLNLRALGDGGTVIDTPIVIGRKAGSSVTVSRHLALAGGSPSLSSCGSGSSVIGVDGKGVVNISAASACTLLFSSSYTAVPVCVVSAGPGGGSSTISSVSTTSVTIELSATYTGPVYYHCIQ